MLQTLSESLRSAEAGGYAVGAFNVSDLNQAYAVLTAAHSASSPVIVQSIAGMSAYENEAWWWARLLEAVVSFTDVPAVLHLDHGRSYDDCRRAIDAGFTSVMIDASRDEITDEPSTFEANVQLTRRVVEVAHAAGVSVEGELGTIGGAEAGLRGQVDEIVFADPDQAEEFVHRTGVDALAVAVGTSHGSVKLGTQRLRIELVSEIKARLPETFLVLHGSSSIEPDAVALINAHGGALPPSHGISTEDKQRAIAAGVRKVNQGTDSHLAWTGALREFLDGDRAAVEPSLATAVAMSAMTAGVERRMHEFGSAGRTRALTPAER